MNCEYSAPAQAVAPYAVPAANHLRGHTEVVSHGFDGVSLVNFVASYAAGVGLRIADRMFAGSQRNDQLGIGLERITIPAFEVIYFGDGFRSRPISVGQRGQRISGVNDVIAPP